jgi:transcriptional regulator with XRE-family HTH domain
MAKKPVTPSKANHFIREWRKSKRLTQERLAEMIGSTSGAISQLENGIINYTQPTLEAIAKALECRPGDLLNRLPEQGSDSPESRLRLAMLAFGVDAGQLHRAVNIIKTFVVGAEQSVQTQPDDQAQPASPHRAKEPSV